MDYPIGTYAYNWVVGLSIGLCGLYIQQINNEEPTSALGTVLVVWFIAIFPVLLVKGYNKFTEKSSSNEKCKCNNGDKCCSNSGKKKIENYPYNFIPAFYSAVSAPYIFIVVVKIEKITVTVLEKIAIGIILIVIPVLLFNFMGYSILNAYEKGRQGDLVMYPIIKIILFGYPLRDNIASSIERIIEFMLLAI
jgi:hypothetical protein